LSPDEERQRRQLTDRLGKLQPRILHLVTRKEPTDAERKELEGLLAERARAATDLADLAATVSRREVAALDAVRDALPADAALIAWVDARAKSVSVEAHWGCVLRATGEPAWERLPGTGPGSKWTKDDDGL